MVERVTKGDGLRIRAPGSRRPVHVDAGRPLTDPNESTAGPAGYAVIDARTGAVLGEHKSRQLPFALK